MTGRILDLVRGVGTDLEYCDVSQGGSVRRENFWGLEAGSWAPAPGSTLG